MTRSSTFILRRPTDLEQDRDALHALFRVPEVYRYLADGVEPPPDIAEAWVAESSSHEAAGLGLWLLSEAETERPVLGCVRLAHAAEVGTAEITYVLHPSLWGQGLATAAAGLAIQDAFNAGHVWTIVAGADLPNVASIQVMKRLGMTQPRGVLYPAGPGVEYSLTKEAFANAPLFTARVQRRTRSS